MKKNSQNYQRLILLILVFNLLFPSASAVVTCGSYYDGPTCHTNTLDGGLYHTAGDKVIVNGVGNWGNNNRYYYIDTSFTSTYKTLAQNAVNSWIYTTSSVGVSTPISLKSTTVQTNSVFDILVGSGLSSQVYGQTRYYNSSGEIKPDSKQVLLQNYSWAKCYINVTKLNSDGQSNSQKQSTIAHEFGHAMGLSEHNCKAYTIMCQTAEGRTATIPTAEDCHAINHLYNK